MLAFKNLLFIFTIIFGLQARAAQLPSDACEHVLVRDPRQIYIPTIAAEIAKMSTPPWVVVLAGNTFHDGTYHNLASDFGYKIQASLPIKASVTSRPISNSVPMQIFYDDSTARADVFDARTEGDTYRTETGELWFSTMPSGRSVGRIKIEFVLSPYDPSLFGDSHFQQVLNAIDRATRNP